MHSRPFPIPSFPSHQREESATIPPRSVTGAFPSRTAAASAGDFFAEELAKHLIDLRRYAKRLCFNPADQEDLVQATALRAWSKRHLFDFGSDMAAWLMHMMHNVYVNKWRTQKARSEVATVPLEYLDGMSVAPRAEDLIFVRETLAAMNTLPDTGRDVFFLSVDYEESVVMRRLDLKKGTVRSRLSRARDSLCKAIGEERKVLVKGRRSA